MIFELVVDAIVSLVTAVVGLLPDSPPPGWLSNLAGNVETLVGLTAGLGAWAPIGLMFTVSAAVVACMVIGFVVKVVRIVASFITLGGGAAG